jgi:hypothetical protein
MASVVEICSNALRLIGAKPITDLTDDTDRARLCNALWPGVRDAVLRAHPWRFARTRATLAMLVAAPVWEYANAFQIPVDPVCLRIWKTSLDAVDQPWEKEGDTIVTNATAIKIVYIARIEDPGLYDASFVQAASARLASELAYPVASSTSLAAGMWTLYRGKIAEARYLDSTEASPTGFRSDDLVVARTGGVSNAQLPIRVIS